MFICTARVEFAVCIVWPPKPETVAGAVFLSKSRIIENIYSFDLRSLEHECILLETTMKEIPSNLCESTDKLEGILL